MFARAKTALAVVVVSLVLFGPAPVVATEVEEAIERLDESLEGPDARCVPDPGDVAQLLRAIDSSSSDVAQIRGLRWLSTMPFWTASTRKGKYWKMFLRLSTDEYPFAMTYYAGIAMIMQQDELISALISQDRDGVDFYLRENENTNHVYADLARLALLQFELWDLAAMPPGLPVADQPVTDKLIPLFSEIFESDAAKEFFTPTSIIKDLLMSKAIYSGLFRKIDDEYWGDVYEELGADAPIAFDPELGVSQVNSRFMSPGRIVADTVFGPQSRICPDTVRELSGNRFFEIARKGRGKILNPVYAIDHVCRAAKGTQSVGEIAESMVEVENRDYRVIVGHTREGLVRFSRLSPDELEQQIVEHVADYRPVEPKVQESEPPCLASADRVFFEQRFNVGRFQSRVSDDGYIYVGEGLTEAEALHLLDFVKSERAFRGAYIFRPVDRR